MKSPILPTVSRREREGKTEEKGRVERQRREWVARSLPPSPGPFASLGLVPVPLPSLSPRQL